MTTRHLGGPCRRTGRALVLATFVGAALLAGAAPAAATDGYHGPSVTVAIPPHESPSSPAAAPPTGHQRQPGSRAPSQTQTPTPSLSATPSPEPTPSATAVLPGTGTGHRPASSGPSLTWLRSAAGGLLGAGVVGAGLWWQLAVRRRRSLAVGA